MALAITVLHDIKSWLLFFFLSFFFLLLAHFSKTNTARHTKFLLENVTQIILIMQEGKG